MKGEPNFLFPENPELYFKKDGLTFGVCEKTGRIGVYAEVDGEGKVIQTFCNLYRDKCGGICSELPKQDNKCPNEKPPLRIED